MAPQLHITYVRSAIGHDRSQKATIQALGLRRLQQTVVHADTPQLRGMIFKVRHLVRVVESNGTAASRREGAPQL